MLHGPLRGLCLAALVAGCGHTQLLCPRNAGPEWHQLESRHFVVTTDLPPLRARPLLGEFERTYRSFLDVTGWRFPGRGEPPGSMRVVVFSRRRDYDAVAPPHTDGFYKAESIVADAAVVIDNDGTHGPGQVFLHELTHRLIRYYVPNTPLALNEGLAEYFSTFEVRDGFAHTGEPPRRLAEMPPLMQLPNVGQLMSIDSLEGMSPLQTYGVYVGGWFLVHTLARFYPQQLGEILARMADGETFAQAYATVIGNDHYAQLNTRYAAAVFDAYHAQPGRVMVQSWKKPYHAVDGDAPIEHEAPVGDAALHLLWAELQQRDGDVAAQVALAEAHGGQSAQLAFMRALVHLSHKEYTAAERDLATAVDARPDEERYRLGLARVHALMLETEPTQRNALAEDMDWLTKNAQAPTAIALVALYHALRGDLPTAREQVRRSLAIDPTNAFAYYALAIAHAEDGDIDGAVDAAERSMHLTPEGSSALPTRALVAKLRALRAQRDQRLIRAR